MRCASVATRPTLDQCAEPVKEVYRIVTISEQAFCRWRRLIPGIKRVAESADKPNR